MSRNEDWWKTVPKRKGTSVAPVLFATKEEKTSGDFVLFRLLRPENTCCRHQRAEAFRHTFVVWCIAHHARTMKTRLFVHQHSLQKKHPCLATRTGGRLSLRGGGLPWHLCCLEGSKKGGKGMESDWNPKIQKRLTHKSIHVKHGRCLVCSHHLSWKWCVVGVVFRLLKSSF